jgi:hypothetical protein
MPWIELTPLAEANTASIHRVGYTTGAVTGQPSVARAHADTRVDGEMNKRLGVLNESMHTHPNGRLTGVSRPLGWVCMKCEVSKSELTHGPWKTRSYSSACQTGGTTHLVKIAQKVTARMQFMY